MSDFMSFVVLTAAIWVWWRFIKHHHTWTSWTDWVPNEAGFRTTDFLRERYCQTCHKTERHKIGTHDCEYRPCPHKDIFVSAFDVEIAIAKRERELGL